MKKLFIDLEKLHNNENVSAGCSYYYENKNAGINRLRELAQFLFTCRKCENSACVNACPREALQRDMDGKITRFTMRCVSCKSCSIACPFGIISPDTVPYITSQCDVCVDRSDKEEPLCVKTCSVEGALKFIEVEESEKDDIYLIGKHIAVHAKPWKKYHP
jgi:Fe-S-cluster-containing dehydrogenase component